QRTLDGDLARSCDFPDRPVVQPLGRRVARCPRPAPAMMPSSPSRTAISYGYLGLRRTGFFLLAALVDGSRASSFHACRSFGFLSIRSSSCSPRGFWGLAGGAFSLLIIGN